MYRHLKISSYLKKHHYKHQLVNNTWENNCCLILESSGTHISWEKCVFQYYKRGYIQKPLSFKTLYSEAAERVPWFTHPHIS